jgi:lysophospholipase L1-like esterase
MAGSLLLALVLAELVLRWTGYEYKPLKIDTRNIDRRSFHVFEDEHFVYDPELIWRPKASHDIFNAQGFRGPELPPQKPDDAFWVFAIGDSNTLGSQGEDGGNWPGSLHTLLQNACQSFQVVNAGVWGYSSHQGLILLKRILEYHPDLVLISFGSNDAHPVRTPDSQYGAGSAWSGRIREMLEPFHLGRLALGMAKQLTGLRGDEMAHRVSPEEYRQNLTDIVRLARARNVVVVLLTRPYMGPMPRLTRWKSFGHDYNAATAEVAEELEVPLVDLYTHFKDRENFFADESHFTDEGHELAAEIVLEHLQPWVRGNVTSRCGP